MNVLEPKVSVTTTTTRRKSYDSQSKNISSSSQPSDDIKPFSMSQAVVNTLSDSVKRAMKIQLEERLEVKRTLAVKHQNKKQKINVLCEFEMVR